jgi:hypothetical protein
MRIRNRHDDIPADHELMPTTREWAIEPERPETLESFRRETAPHGGISSLA